MESVIFLTSSYISNQASVSARYVTPGIQIHELYGVGRWEGATHTHSGSIGLFSGHHQQRDKSGLTLDVAAEGSQRILSEAKKNARC